MQKLFDILNYGMQKQIGSTTEDIKAFKNSDEFRNEK